MGDGELAGISVFLIFPVGTCEFQTGCDSRCKALEPEEIKREPEEIYVFSKPRCQNIPLCQHVLPDQRAVEEP